MKKLAVYILVPSLIVGSCGAGVYVYQKNKQANTYVKVVPVSSISTSDYGSDMYMYGQVVNNQRQQISVTTSQKISEVLVKKGDNVNIGDPILKMDTTMDNLNLQDLDIQIQKKVLEISEGFTHLKKKAQVRKKVHPKKKAQVRKKVHPKKKAQVRKKVHLKKKAQVKKKAHPKKKAQVRKKVHPKKKAQVKKKVHPRKRVHLRRKVLRSSRPHHRNQAVKSQQSQRSQAVSRRVQSRRVQSSRQVPSRHRKVHLKAHLQNRLRSSQARISQAQRNLVQSSQVQKIRVRSQVRNQRQNLPRRLIRQAQMENS